MSGDDRTAAARDSGPAGRRRGVQVIAVTGGKGGVGKSTVSVNVAVGFAAAGRKTLLLDGDFGLANADIMLGITPRFTLADLISGQRSLEEILTPVRDNLVLIAGASGITQVAGLGEAEHIGIVRAFSSLVDEVDVLVVDTPAGISPGVLQLTQAAQHVMVVVCDEPASVTDAYAVIKVLSSEHDLRHFKIVTNMTRPPSSGRHLFNALLKVTNRFLDVILEHAVDIPDDDLLRRAIREQRPVIEAYPGSPSAAAFRNLVRTASDWDIPVNSRGNIEFFAERLVAPPIRRMQVIK
jgi:flagellar biosynthesis protein FlhG